jgi:hypothetical protein
MSQRTANSSWGRRPSKKPQAAASIAAVNKFVSGGKEDTVRLNVDIPRALRARVKSRCALEGRDIRDVVIEMLEQRFPE